MGEIQTLLEDEQFDVSEIAYDAENGITVRLVPSNHESAERGVRVIGCSWPAEWTDREMAGPTLTDDELVNRKGDAIAEAREAVENAVDE